jgi:hypothetical protein
VAVRTNPALTATGMVAMLGPGNLRQIVLGPNKPRALLPVSNGLASTEKLALWAATGLRI